MRTRKALDAAAETMDETAPIKALRARRLRPSPLRERFFSSRLYVKYLTRRTVQGTFSRNISKKGSRNGPRNGATPRRTRCRFRGGPLWACWQARFFPTEGSWSVRMLSLGYWCQHATRPLTPTRYKLGVVCADYTKQQQETK